MSRTRPKRGLQDDALKKDMTLESRHRLIQKIKFSPGVTGRRWEHHDEACREGNDVRRRRLCRPVPGLVKW